MAPTPAAAAAAMALWDGSPPPSVPPSTSTPPPPPATAPPSRPTPSCQCSPSSMSASPGEHRTQHIGGRHQGTEVRFLDEGFGGRERESRPLFEFFLPTACRKLGLIEIFSIVFPDILYPLHKMTADIPLKRDLFFASDGSDSRRMWRTAASVGASPSSQRSSCQRSPICGHPSRGGSSRSAWREGTSTRSLTTW